MTPEWFAIEFIVIASATWAAIAFWNIDKQDGRIRALAEIAARQAGQIAVMRSDLDELASDSRGEPEDPVDAFVAAIGGYCKSVTVVDEIDPATIGRLSADLVVDKADAGHNGTYRGTGFDHPGHGNRE